MNRQDLLALAAKLEAQAEELKKEAAKLREAAATLNQPGLFDDSDKDD